MFRRIQFWRCAVWILSALALPAPAQALITLTGVKSAEFQWAPARGPVVGYYVLIARNGSDYEFHSAVRGRTSATVEGEFGDVIVVRVAAFGASGFGPVSDASEPIEFVAAPAPDPTPDPDPAPDPDPTPDPDPAPGDDPGDDNEPPPAPGRISGTPLDFDGDGAADLLTRNSSSGALELWLMDASGVARVQPIENPGSSWNIAGNGDYNGDGLTDILWSHPRMRWVMVFFMEGAHVQERVVLSRDPRLRSSIVGSGDYDGDGVSDILLSTGNADGPLELWTLNDDYSVASSSLPNDFGSTPQVIASGDYDGDNMADILWRNGESGEVEVWGLTGELGVGTLDDLRDGWSIAGSGDVDGDGSDDLVLKNDSSGDFAVRLSSTRNRHEIGAAGGAGVGPGYRRLFAALRQLAAMGDYDADGRTDLVVHNGGTTEIWHIEAGAVGRVEEIDSLSSGWFFAGVGAENPN